MEVRGGHHCGEYRAIPADFEVPDCYRVMMTYRIVLNMICGWVIRDCDASYQDLRLLVQGFQALLNLRFRFRRLWNPIEVDPRSQSQNFDYFYS